MKTVICSTLFVLKCGTICVSASHLKFMRVVTSERVNLFSHFWLFNFLKTLDSNFCSGYTISDNNQTVESCSPLTTKETLIHRIACENGQTIAYGVRTFNRQQNWNFLLLLTLKTSLLVLSSGKTTSYDLFSTLKRLSTPMKTLRKTLTLVNSSKRTVVK